MSSDPGSPLQIGFTPEFKRNLRQLAKRYHHIKSDLQPILNQLASGSHPGDQVPRVRYEVFKVRAPNSDASRGKSGGYRVIDWVKSESEVVLVTVYSKTDQSDIAPEDIRKFILNFDAAVTRDAELNQNSTNGAEPEASTGPPG